MNLTQRTLLISIFTCTQLCYAQPSSSITSNPTNSTATPQLSPPSIDKVKPGHWAIETTVSKNKDDPKKSLKDVCIYESWNKKGLLKNPPLNYGIPGTRCDATNSRISPDGIFQMTTTCQSLSNLETSQGGEISANVSYSVKPLADHSFEINTIIDAQVNGSKQTTTLKTNMKFISDKCQSNSHPMR